MLITGNVEAHAHSALHRISEWIHTELRVARAAPYLEGLPDDRLTDIGIERDKVRSALRHGREGMPNSMNRRRGGMSLQSPILTPWTYP